MTTILPHRVILKLLKFKNKILDRTFYRILLSGLFISVLAFTEDFDIPFFGLLAFLGTLPEIIDKLKERNKLENI
jgi:hypothetical protein